MSIKAMPKIVCLCGSMRFLREFREYSRDHTLMGKIVLMPNVDMKTDAYFQAGFSATELERIKQDLDALHLRKIDMADEVLILNIGGYIGESTRREIAYAESQHKKIRYVE